MGDTASISIIIPTHGDAPYLMWTLRSLEAARLHQSCHEVLVVENGVPCSSTKLTVQKAVERFNSTMLSPIRYVYEPVPGLLAGRHRGLHESSGDVLTFIDDDVVVDEDWFSTIVAALTNPEVAVVGGPSRPVFLGPTPAWVVARRRRFRAGWFLGELSLIDADEDLEDVDLDLIWGLNFTIRKEVLLRAEGFHPDIVPSEVWFSQGDGETGLTRKLKQNGFMGVFRRDASVRHVIPAERLTSEYLERRYKFQGHCDAYSALREGTWQPKAARTAARRGRGRQAWVLRRGKSALPDPRGAAYTAGWNELGFAYTKHAAIREWVHLPHYLDRWEPRNPTRCDSGYPSSRIPKKG